MVEKLKARRGKEKSIVIQMHISLMIELISSQLLQKKNSLKNH